MAWSEAHPACYRASLAAYPDPGGQGDGWK